eukprot:233860-Hanusia_phi.AAC.4
MNSSSSCSLCPPLLNAADLLVSRKVNMNKLRSEYITQMRKRKENEAKEEERRRQIEEEMLSQTAEEPIEE